jgi:hypothetical protein
LRENDVFLPAINELINYIGFKYEINRFFGKKPDIEAKHSFEAVKFAINTLKNICDELEKADKDYYIVLSPSGHDLNFQQDYHASVLSMVSSLLPDVILLSKPLASEENTFRDDSIHYTIAGHAAVAKYLSQTIPLGLTP